LGHNKDRGEKKVRKEPKKKLKEKRAAKKQKKGTNGGQTILNQ
jgi:hypothetical protein